MLRLHTLEKYFFVASLLLLSGALLPLWREMSGYNLNFVEGDPLQQVIFTTIYLISFLFLLLRPKCTLDNLRNGIYLLPLLVWVLLSVFWSYAPEVTVRREIAILGTTIFGLYLASRFEYGEFLRLLGWTLLVSVVLSYFFILIIPDWGIMVDSRGEAWRGIYAHKNQLGRINVLIVIVFFLLAKSELRWRYLWWIGLILSVCLIIGSRSATAIIMLIILSILVPVIKFIKWRNYLSIPFIIIFVIIIGSLTWLISSNLVYFLGIIGRDSTLTGRIYLWEAVIHMASQRPWLGYGYGAFWLGLDGPSALIWQSGVFHATNAHNSYLELWLTLGVIGVFLFGLSYFKALHQSLILLIKTNNYLTLWPLYYLAFLAIYGSSEIGILQQNNYLWVLYVSIVVRVGYKKHDLHNHQVKSIAQHPQ